MGNIGDAPVREVEYEPFPETAPAEPSVPSPAPAPAEPVKTPEKVPA